MSDDEKIKEMANLLKEGAKMLSYICPECKVPLFQLKNGVIICPSCKRRAVFSDADVSATPSEEVKKFEIKSKENVFYDNLKSKIYVKIMKLLDSIEYTEDFDKINEILSIIERLARIMKEL
ncbi:MAG: Sjogren's syndrome/scleroderma autoantigen 1 family protein [Candidatus Methanomethylicia archaeon]